MNLKEIQDNAPEGATHYYINEFLNVDYFKDFQYTWIQKCMRWFNLTEIGQEQARSVALPLYPTPKEKEEMKKYGEYTETSYNYDATWLDFSSKDGTIETTLIDNKKLKDPTNPSHYKQGKVECIDAIESAVVGKKGIEASLVGNIIKYLWRYEEKNGVEDVEKAKWYLDKLLDIMHR